MYEDPDVTALRAAGYRLLVALVVGAALLAGWSRARGQEAAEAVEAVPAPVGGPVSGPASDLMIPMACTILILGLGLYVWLLAREWYLNRKRMADRG
jgi:hypothetical protein